MQFKTFYVMVQSSEARKDWSRVIFQNILCYGLIGAWSGIAVSGVPFQNILCYGSIKKREKLERLEYNFKTFYVMVQWFVSIINNTPTYYFKTFYVMVQFWYKDNNAFEDIISKHFMLWFN